MFFCRKQGRLYSRCIKYMAFPFFVTLCFLFVLVDLLQEAGYFYSISQGSELTVTFVQIAGKEESDDKTKAMSTAMEKIGMLVPDVILLYTSTREILELFLKKVRFCTFICHLFIFLFLRFLTIKINAKQFLYIP